MACDVPGISHVQVLHSGLRGPVQGLPSQFGTRPAAICRSKPSIQNRRAPGSQHSSCDRCPFGVIPCCRRRCPSSRPNPESVLEARRYEFAKAMEITAEQEALAEELLVRSGGGPLPPAAWVPPNQLLRALQPHCIHFCSPRAEVSLGWWELKHPAGVEPHRQPRQAQAQGRKTSCQR